MAIKAVLKMGHPALRAENQQISLEEIKSPEFLALLADMFDTMKDEGGIGIAAPQIGVNKQVAIIEMENENERYDQVESTPLITFINPKITVLDETKQGFWEGCLSVPGLRGFVERPRRVQIDFLNERGEAKTLVAEDFLATVFQHEIDHLFGTLYVDRISDKTKFGFEDELG